MIDVNQVHVYVTLKDHTSYSFKDFMLGIPQMTSMVVSSVVMALGVPGIPQKIVGPENVALAAPSLNPMLIVASPSLAKLKEQSVVSSLF